MFTYPYKVSLQSLFNRKTQYRLVVNELILKILLWDWLHYLPCPDMKQSDQI